MKSRSFCKTSRVLGGCCAGRVLRGAGVVRGGCCAGRVQASRGKVTPIKRNEYGIEMYGSIYKFRGVHAPRIDGPGPCSSCVCPQFHFIFILCAWLLLVVVPLIYPDTGSDMVLNLFTTHAITPLHFTPTVAQHCDHNALQLSR